MTTIEAVKNGTEFLRTAWRFMTDSVAGDITATYMDNGVEKTSTIKNGKGLEKIVTDFTAQGRYAILNNFSIYVDSINGSDSNSGLSSTVPVKTLVKAFSLVPANASTAIYMHGGQTHYLTASVVISTKVIYLSGYNTENGRPVFSNALIGSEDNDGSTTGLYAEHYAYISAYNVNFETATKTNTSIWIGLLQRRKDPRGTIEVYLHSCDVTLGNTPLYRNASGPQNCKFTWYAGSVTNPNNVKLIENAGYSIVDIALTALTLESGTLDDLINPNNIGVRKTW
jgi:hypothetical protein